MKSIIKRDGREVAFDENKISAVISKAFNAAEGAADKQAVMELTLEVIKKLKAEYGEKHFTVENVQDIVETV